jgi:nicotinamidase-related amidase
LLNNIFKSIQMSDRRRFIKKFSAGIAGIGLGDGATGILAKQTGRDLSRQGFETGGMPGRNFLDHCAFVCIDIQKTSYHPMTEDKMPRGWLNMGKTAEDVNRANRYLFDTALPNACRVADACRAAQLPMVFVHWGYRFRNGMDLDPDIYNSFRREIGPDPTKWPHHISAPDSKPADAFSVREGEYVISKTAQDAFLSSNIGYVLQNLGIKNIVFVGGHTGACLGKTSKTAILRGYKTWCVKDATFDAFASTHMENLNATGYHHITTTAEFESFIK